jgi:hypothetical protein
MRPGSEHGPFVFVSHAKADKKAVPLLREVVARLLDDNIAVWIDDPDAFPDFRERARACLRLRGGGKWDDQIDQALDEAACILICVSPTFVKRFREDRHQVIAGEVLAAKIGNRGVVARLEAADWQDMPAWIQREQIVDLVETPDKIDDLVEDVRGALERVNRQRLGARTQAPKWVHPLVPYLASRQPQEEAVSMHLQAAQRPDGNWRTAFFLKGPRNECLDQFRQRLKEHTSPKHLPGGQSWHEEIIAWPRGARSPDDFIQRYESQLHSRDRANGGESLAESLIAAQKPVAVVSMIQLQEWQPSQAGMISTWLQFWRQQTSAAPQMKVVPIFCLELPQLKPGWRVPPDIRERGGISARKIWKDLERLEKQSARDPGMMQLRLLNMLAPVERPDADHWRRDQIDNPAGEEWSRLGKKFDTLFSGRAVRHGVAMQDWAEQISSILKSPPT